MANSVSGTGSRSGSRARSVLLWVLVGVIILLVVGFAALPVLALSHRRTLPLEKAFGNAAVATTARFHGRGKESKVTQDTRALTRAQVAWSTCVLCHGGHGDGKGSVGDGLYPPPANLLDDDTKELSDAQLYWIIRNGLSYTGMPAYAKRFNEDTTWGLVSYIRALQRGQALTFDAPAPPPPGTGPNPDVQRLAVMVTDTDLQPGNLTARTGLVQLDFTNRGTRTHQLMISVEGKVPYAGIRIFPSQVQPVQATLRPGTYAIILDPDSNGSGKSISLVVQ